MNELRHKKGKSKNVIFENLIKYLSMWYKSVLYKSKTSYGLFTLRLRNRVTIIIVMFVQLCEQFCVGE